MLFSLSGCACVAHVLRVRSATHARLSRFSTLALRPIISLFQTRSAPCPRLPRLVRLAPRLVNVWQEITTPLRMLAFRDFQRLLCARLSLCFKHAPRLVFVFLGSCRLLFGKSPLCKQKSSVQDVQPSTTSVVLFSLSGCACVAHVLRVRSATHARLSRFSTLALRLIISLFQTRSAPCPRLP